MTEDQILEYSNEFPDLGTQLIKYAGILLLALSVPTAFVEYTEGVIMLVSGFAFLLAYKLDKIREIIVYDNLRIAYLLKHLEDQQSESLDEFLEAEDCQGWAQLNKITDRHGFGSESN